MEETKMTQNEAMNEETMVSVKHAIREVIAHDKRDCVQRGNELHAIYHDGSQEYVCSIDADGMVRSCDVLGWLGY